jgi:hypothetical protein
MKPFILILAGFLLFLQSCIMTHKKEQTTQDTSQWSELIVYSTASSLLTYKNGIFKATNPVEIKEINEKIKMFTLEIVNTSDQENFRNTQRNPTFRILIKERAEELRDFLLTKTETIDGAYIKQKAEDPK